MNYSKHVVRKMKLSSEMKGKPFHFLTYIEATFHLGDIKCNFSNLFADNI